MTKPTPAISRPFSVTVLTALVGVGLWLLGRTLLVLFAGVLLAILLRSLAGWASRWLRISPGWGLAVVFLMLGLVVGGGGYLMASRVVQEGAELARNLHLAVGQLNQMMSSYLPKGGLSLGPLPSASTLTRQIMGVTSSVTGAVVVVAVVLFIGFYGAIDPDLYINGCVRLMPPASRARTREVLDSVAHTLRWWLLGRTITMTSVAVIAFIGLSLLGIPLAIALSLLAGLMTFVPYLGAIVASVPAVLIALIHVPALIFQVILVYVIAYMAEGYVIAPLVQQRAARLPPALMLVAQALLGTLFGLAGVTLAAPVAAASIVMTRMIYLHDILGDEDAEPPRPPAPARP